MDHIDNDRFNGIPPIGQDIDMILTKFPLHRSFFCYTDNNIQKNNYLCGVKVLVRRLRTG